MIESEKNEFEARLKAEVAAWEQFHEHMAGPFYKVPPQRTWVVFPTMLRKMWSGGEVQAWLDENVNKEKNL